MAWYPPFVPPPFPPPPFPHDEYGNPAAPLPSPNQVAQEVNRAIDSAQATTTAVIRALPGQSDPIAIRSPGTGETAMVTGAVSTSVFNEAITSVSERVGRLEVSVAALQASQQQGQQYGNFGQGYGYPTGFNSQMLGGACGSSGILPGAAQPVYVVNGDFPSSGGSSSSTMDPLLLVLLLSGGLGTSSTTTIDPILLLLLFGGMGGGGGMGGMNPILLLLLLGGI